VPSVLTRALSSRRLGRALVAPVVAALLFAAAPAAGSTHRSAAPEPQGGTGLTMLVGGLRDPLFVTNAGDDRLFVVEKPGRVRIVKHVGGDWRVSNTFLDIRDRVGASGSEQGLLGLAFHPDYETNRRFYVNYTDNGGDTVIAEYRKRANGPDANPGSFRRVMGIKHPFANHNGGWLGFKGSLLYIATGDGGSGGDPMENAQDLESRLGKILRLDPLDPDGNGPKSYSVPASNPFVGRPGLDVIWSYGLRNPWRNSFDAATGDFWIADVGEEEYEEVNRVGSGGGINFGWDRLEGRHRYPSGELCQSDCKTLPVVEYRHTVDGADNCSVTGGYVARRPGAALNGRYVFGDYCSGRMWDISASHDAGDPLPAPVSTGRLISSFGEGSDGRIYLTDILGSLWRVDGT